MPNKKYYRENPGKYIRQTKRYVKANKTIVKLKRHQFYENNKPRIKKEHNSYYKKNKKCVLKKNSEWAKKNKSKLRIYNRNRRRSDPNYYRNRDKNWRKRNPLKVKFNKIKNRYGITYEQVLALLKKQKNRCPICLGKFKKHNFYVDHDHKTGRVRGLLCRLCNGGLGLFRDNRWNLSRAILYIYEWKKSKGLVKT